MNVFTASNKRFILLIVKILLKQDSDIVVAIVFSIISILSAILKFKHVAISTILNPFFNTQSALIITISVD